MNKYLTIVKQKAESIFKYKKQIVKTLAGFLILYLIVSTHIEKINTYETVSPRKGTITQKVECSGNLLPYKVSKITLPESSQIKKIYVKVGQHVKKGQILVQLEDKNEQEQYRSALNAYYSAAAGRNRLRDALNSSSSQNTNYLSKLAKQIEDNANGDPQLLSIAASLKAFAAATSSQNLTTGLNSSLSLAQSSVNMAYAQVKQMEALLESKKIRAPIDGTVYIVQVHNFDKGNSNSISIPSGMSNLTSLFNASDFNSINTSSGDFNAAKDNVIYIVNDSSWYSYCNISQLDIFKVKKGQEVLAKIKNTDKRLYGKTTFVYKIPNNLQAENPLYAIQIKFNKIKQKVLPGLNLNIQIITAKKQNTVIVPAEAIYYDKNNKPYVKVLTNTGYKRQYVELGIQEITQIEVVKDLTTNIKLVIKENKPKHKVKITPFYRIKQLFK